ncbi:MAG: ATP-binding protein [Vulcanisaeta sp.]|nr:ATP-binding protein [Vulcanisaeta sp.]
MRIQGTIPYGNKEVAVNINIDYGKPMTILIGPNLTGKSITLMCIAEMYGKRQFVRGYVKSKIDSLKRFVRCEGGERFDYTVFVDAYRVTAQPIEYISKDLEEIQEDVDELIRGEEKALPALERIKSRVRRIEELLYEKSIIQELKNYAPTHRISMAYRKFEEVKEDFNKLIEETAGEIDGEGAGRFKAALSHFSPLFIDLTNDGWLWSDLEVGIEGSNIEVLSSVFAPSLVILYAVLTYAMQGTKALLIEEPEAHAHPSMSMFLGYLLTKLAMSDNTMRVITATHNYEFLQGALMAGEEAVDVYVFNRRSEGGVFTLVAEQWNHAAVIPGFTEPGILSIYGRKS